MSVKIYNGVEYDAAHRSIVCRADMDGAEVFRLTGDIGWKRILAHSEDMAAETYRLTVKADPRYCRLCRRIPCMCSDDEDDDVGNI